MSSTSNLPTPSYQSGSSYELFVKELRIWSKITIISKKKQGLHVLLCLPNKEKDPSGLKEKLLEECDLEKLNEENGIDELILLMNKHLAKDSIQDVWEKFQDFEDCEKKSDETWFQYITRFDSVYERVKNKGLSLPQSILAFKLLRGAKLNEEERLVIMTGLDFETRQTAMYEDAKSALKKFKGGASASVVKNEFETFYTHSHRRPYNRNSYRGRGRSSDFRRGSYTPRGNPLDRSGKPLRCLKCESLLHFIKDCPHREEKVACVEERPEGKDEKEENVPIIMFTKNEDELILLTKEATSCGVLDSGCASTVCGKQWLEMYMDQLSEEKKNEVVKNNSNKSFQFGGEYKLKSLGKYVLPASILGTEVAIETDVVDSNIPLLFSNKALGAMKAKIDYSNDEATIFDQKTTLERTSAGHHCIKITPDEVFFAESECLSEKAILKLHKQYGHPGKSSFVKHIQVADMWDEKLRPIVDKIYESCSICQQFASARPRPVVSLPMASIFNETVAIDLKAWKNVWILYMIDMFSRFTVATWVKRKRPEEIIEAIIKEWIGILGVMKKLLSDNGGEFNGEEIRAIESLLNIEHDTTGAESPFQNGLCERNHAVTDMILCKLQAEYPNTSLTVLLKWATMAKNSMQMWAGFSSHQLVFGVNPNLPNVMENKIPALESGDYCKSYSKIVAAMHTAREEFTKSEASEKIKRALRHNIRVSNQAFNAGEKVFYRKEGLEHWQGPATVIGQDGKVVIIKHASHMLRTSPSRLLKALSYDEKDSYSEPLYGNIQDNEKNEQENQQTNEQPEPEQANQQTNEQPNEIRRSLRIFNKETGAKVYNSDTHDIFAVNIPRNEQNSPECLEAKKEELTRLQEFGVYEEVPDQGQACISTKWVMVKKGERVKARLTARGFEEDIISAVDSPTIGKNCVRILLAIAASKHWTIKSTDVKSAFLQGQELQRDVYLQPPKEASTSKDQIWKLRRCLYGLNDAARQFYMSLSEELIKLGAVKSKLDPSLFAFYSKKGLEGLLVSHVDDFLHAGEQSFEETMDKLCKRFSAGSKETTTFKYTGYQLHQQKDYSIIMDQNDYIKNVTIENLSSARLVQKGDKLSEEETTQYRKCLGILGWIVQGTRPEMAFTQLESSTKTKNATVGDLHQLIKLVKNAQSTERKILFSDLGDPNVEQWSILMFADASYANLNAGTGSCGGHVVFLLGKDGKVCPLSWRSSKIKRVCRSTAAAEGMSLSQGLEEAIYNRNVITELLRAPKNSISITGITDHEGLQGNVCNALKPKVDDLRLRQEIAIIREYLHFGEIDQVKLCATARQLADCLTKKGAAGHDLIKVLEEGILPGSF